MNLLAGTEKEANDEANDIEESSGKNRRKNRRGFKECGYWGCPKKKDKDGEWEEEEEINGEEIIEAVKRIKLGKAAGIDGIPMEAWRYGDTAVRSGLMDLLK